MIKDVAGQLFRKCISLLEQRLHIKITSAVLLINSDYGEYEFHLKDNDYENLTLMSKFFHKRLIEVVGRKQFIAGLVICDVCLGAGETVKEDGFISDCTKCKGGGEVARVYPTAQTELYKKLEGEQNDDEQV